MPQIPDTDELINKWDSRYRKPDTSPRVADVLLLNRHLLPQQGRALELACGLGANALLLAQAGLETTAWDISSVAIERLRQQANKEGLTNLHASIRNVETSPPDAESFDVIVVSYYLERNLMPAILNALKPGGLLFYQTFTRIAVTDQGPSCLEFRLADNELLRLCKPLALRFYREENRLGDLTKGIRDVAMLVGEKKMATTVKDR